MGRIQCGAGFDAKPQRTQRSQRVRGWFLTQRWQRGGEAEGAGLGATAPDLETGVAGNRLAAIGASPLSVPASKLANGKGAPRQPYGFPGPSG